MTTSEKAHFLYPPAPGYGSAGHVPGIGAAMHPESGPAILWGQGTPGAIPPWTLVNKGSLWISVDQTDDTTALYMKVDEGGDADDWTRVFVEGGALIDNSDLTGTAGITVENLETNALSNHARSILVDCSDGASETIPLYAVAALTITQIDVVATEAFAASMGGPGDITIGTGTGGAQIVTATAYTPGLAIGANQNLSIASGAVAADGSVFQSHDIASGSVGEYHAHYLWDFNS